MKKSLILMIYSLHIFPGEGMEFKSLQRKHEFKEPFIRQSNGEHYNNNNQAFYSQASWDRLEINHMSKKKKAGTKQE
jgi:hypothetical protein